jgi:hypothetical protein
MVHQFLMENMESKWFSFKTWCLVCVEGLSIANNFGVRWFALKRNNYHVFHCTKAWLTMLYYKC